MAVMMVIAMNPRIMGRLTLPRPMLAVGWLATLAMALATIVFLCVSSRHLQVRTVGRETWRRRAASFASVVPLQLTARPDHPPPSAR
jgi:hypothetical protein